MMTREQIQTVLEALSAATCYPEAGCEDKRYEESIAILIAALARVDKPLEPSEPVYIRRDQLQKARRQAYLCEVGPEPRKDKVAVFTHPAPSKPMEPSEPDCSPNHLCNGRMVHLPNGEQCDKCGETP